MLRPDEVYTLEKSIWSQEDFELMGWHDATIHAIAFHPDVIEFVLDIDYIFAWVKPESPSIYYKHWVSPATLVFESVKDLKIEIQDLLGPTILDVGRKVLPPPQREDGYIPQVPDWSWIIDLVQGKIEFSAVGFTQYTRKAPICVSVQSLTIEERGASSFERPENVL